MVCADQALRCINCFETQREPHNLVDRLPFSKLRITDNKTMATTTSDEQHFRFFELPRELRDWIYAELLDGEVEVDVLRDDGRGLDIGSPTVTAYNVPEPQLHTVCRQFHEELHDAESRHMGVRIEDDYQALLGRDFGLPQHLLSARTLKAYVTVPCEVHGDLDGWDCAVHWHMNLHGTWLEAVIDEMHNLHSMEVVAFAPGDRPIAYERVFVEEGYLFTDLPHLQRLTLVEEGDAAAGAQKGAEGPLLLEWTEQSDMYTTFGDVDLSAEVVREPKDDWDY